MCIDYRKLNEVTEYDIYPLPRINKVIDELAKSKILSTLDATIGYYQIVVREKGLEKTAFGWWNGFYVFIECLLVFVMPCNVSKFKWLPFSGI